MLEVSLSTKQYGRYMLQPVDSDDVNAKLDPNVEVTTPTLTGDMKLILADEIMPEGGLELYIIPGTALESTGEVVGDADPGTPEELIRLEVKLTVTQANATRLNPSLLAIGNLTDLPPEIKAKAGIS